MSDLAVSRIRTIYAAAILFVSFLLITLPAVPLAHAATCAEKGAGWSCTTDTAGKTCVTGLCPGGADNKCCSSAGGTAAGSSAAAGAPSLTAESEVFKPLGDTSIPEIIGNVIKYATGLVGVIALAMFIYGGLTWMLAAGNQEKVTKAKNTIVWSVLGIVMVFAAYAFVSFVIRAVGG